MNKCRDLTLTGSLSATVNLLITEKNGATRSRTILMATKSFADGTEKRFIRFTEPADVRGTSMLIVDNKNVADEMWIYLPALKRTRRIVSSEKGKSFMSSEFSNSDMSSPAPSDFTNRFAPGSAKDNQWIIESTPVDENIAEEYGFSRKISYISMDKCQIKKMEFYNFDNELFKTLEINKVFPLPEGKYLVSEMKAVNVLKGRSSEIRFTDINARTRIEDSYFTVQNLER